VGQGKKVIAIDLNPLSRTAIAADISIVDELTRAVDNMIILAESMSKDIGERSRALNDYNNDIVLKETMGIMCENLTRGA
jgi:4-phosphopantoate--beta-alanine ligase